MPLPSTTPPSQGTFQARGGADPPSLSRSNASTPAGQVRQGGSKLPQNASQEHRVYDLRAYTGYLSNYDRPHQAIVDWVMRETGTDVWFTEPFGFLSAKS